MDCSKGFNQQTDGVVVGQSCYLHGLEGNMSSFFTTFISFIVVYGKRKPYWLADSRRVVCIDSSLNLCFKENMKESSVQCVFVMTLRWVNLQMLYPYFANNWQFLLLYGRLQRHVLGKISLFAKCQSQQRWTRFNSD